MANGHGGPRTPSKPAAVSGPGALSARTDGRPQPVRDLPDAGYGEGAAFREMQQGAPMASAAPPGAAGGGVNPLAGLTGMGAPTTMPNEPVTAGANAGPGPGSDVLGLPADVAKLDSEHLRRYLPILIKRAQSESATPSFKKYVRTLIAQL